MRHADKQTFTQPGFIESKFSNGNVQLILGSLNPRKGLGSAKDGFELISLSVGDDDDRVLSQYFRQMLVPGVSSIALDALRIGW